MPKFTVFVRQSNNKGTTWIGSVDAETHEHAAGEGAAECASDWGCSLDEVSCVGVAAGNVEILFWDDVTE